MMKPNRVVLTAISALFLANSSSAQLPESGVGTLRFAEADRVVVCSDFEEFSADSLASRAEDRGMQDFRENIFVGPIPYTMPENFGVLVVVVGKTAKRSTLACAIESVPSADVIVPQILQVQGDLGLSYADRMRRDGYEPKGLYALMTDPTLMLGLHRPHWDLNLATLVYGVQELNEVMVDDVLARLLGMPSR